MRKNVAFSTLRVAISPEDISFNPEAPRHIILMDTLGSVEKEMLACSFVGTSREHGKWVGFIYEERAGENTLFAEMIEEGLMVETQIEGFWMYQLSQFAIETIYVRQSRAIIRSLSATLERQRKMTFWQHLRNMFRTVVSV